MNSRKLLIILIISAIIFIINGLSQQQEGSELKSIGSLNIEVTSINVTEKNEITRVIVNKSIEPIGSGLRFRYDINTPRIDDFYFVLALDSSTSLKVYPNAEQAKAIIEAVPKFIDDTIAKYNTKNFSISIISWDNDTDFAYGDLNNTDPKNAKLVPIQWAQNDLKKGFFKEVDNPNYRYRIQAEEGTNLSVALMSSIDVLKNNPVTKYHRTSKFIILVAGEDGEFEKCNESLLFREAKTEGVSIYAIVMNPSNNGNMLAHLMRLTDNKTQSCEAAPGELSKLLEMQLENALSQAISEPAATNVTLVEPWYSYLKFGNEALIELKGKKYPIPYTTKSVVSNSSTYFNIKNGLYADNITMVSFDAEMNFSLPGSFEETSPSILNYTWLKETKGFSIIVPRNNISIKSVPLGAKSQKLGIEFGVITIFSFLVIFIIGRSRN